LKDFLLKDLNIGEQFDTAYENMLAVNEGSKVFFKFIFKNRRPKMVPGSRHEFPVMSVSAFGALFSQGR
jgi:hypothetical protein